MKTRGKVLRIAACPFPKVGLCFLKMVPSQTRGQECHEFNVQPPLAYSEIRGGEGVKEQGSEIVKKLW